MVSLLHGVTLIYIVIGICILASNYAASNIDYYILISIFLSTLRPTSTRRLKTIQAPSYAIILLSLHIFIEIALLIWGIFSLTSSTGATPLSVSAFGGVSCALQIYFTGIYIAFPFISKYKYQEKKQQPYTMTPLQIQIDISDL